MQYRGTVPKRQIYQQPIAQQEARPAQPQQTKAVRGTPVSQSLGDVEATGKEFWTYVFPASGKLLSPGLHVSKVVGEVYVEIIYNGETMHKAFVVGGVNEMTDRAVEAGDRVSLVAHSVPGEKPGVLEGAVVAFMWSPR